VCGFRISGHRAILIARHRAIRDKTASPRRNNSGTMPAAGIGNRVRRLHPQKQQPDRRVLNRGIEAVQAVKMLSRIIDTFFSPVGKKL